MEFHRKKVFRVSPDKKSYALNKRLAFLRYEHKIEGRRGRYCHQKMFKKGTLEIWLAVGDAAAPVNFFQRVLQSLSDTVLICKPCLEQKNWCGYKKFDIGKYPLRYWKIQNGLDHQYRALNLAEQLSLSSRILYYKMLKLEHRGKGLSGAVVNLRATLTENVVKLLPRNDAMKYICHQTMM